MSIVDLLLLLERMVRLVVAAGRTTRAAIGGLARRRGPSTGASPQTGAVFAGTSLMPPFGRLPPVVRGRADLLASLADRRRAPAGQIQVLAGVGGSGKSTIALELARRLSTGRRPQAKAWWLYAHELGRLTEGLASLTHELGGNDLDVHAVRAGSGAARDRLWALLETARPGWLLVFDDADRPELLDPDDDGRGWLRSSHRGLVLVTSRLRDPQLWGRDAVVSEVPLLPVAEAAEVLIDLVGEWPGRPPDQGSGQPSDPQAESDARALAVALGRLPLALHLAGRYLDTAPRGYRSLRTYQQIFEGGAEVLAPTGIARANPRTTVTQTWEISLDYLHEQGIPQARSLVRLLSCYAAATPIPASLVQRPEVAQLRASDNGGWQQWLADGLHGLLQLSVIEPHDDPADTGTGPGWWVHPIIAEANRAHLTGVWPTVASTRPGPHPQTIRRVAVSLLSAALHPLRPDDNRSWPRYAHLDPHVRELISSAGELDQDPLATLIVAVADVVAFHSWRGHEHTGLQLADRATTAAAKLPTEHPAQLRLAHERAWATGRGGDWREAVVQLRRLREVRSRVIGPGHADTLDTRHRLAWAVGRLGDWAAAEMELGLVLDDRAQLLGAEDPDTLHTRCCLAWAVSQNGRLAEAEATYREVIAVRSRVLGDDHVETWDARHSLAEAYVHHGRYRKAEVLLREVIAAQAGILKLQYPEALEVRPRYWLGWALRGQGRSAEARRLFTQLLRDQERALGADHPATRQTRHQLYGYRMVAGR